MKIDLTYQLSKELMDDFAKSASEKALSKFGHFGTHFDIQDKVFPLEYCERNGIAFDVSYVCNRDIEASDIDMNLISEGDFVLFHTGMIERAPYGSKEYFTQHPQLSQNMIEVLISKKASLIGLDMAGVRRGEEHALADQLCADHGTYIIENLVNLKSICNIPGEKPKLLVHTYPLNLSGYTGIPARVIVDIQD